MKTSAVVILVLVCFGAATRLIAQMREESPLGPASERLFVQNGAASMPNLRTNSSLAVLWKASPTVRVQPLGRPGNGQLPPGTYETEPYTCIVVVPGPVSDDRMIIGRPRTLPGTNVFVPRMPIVNPELRFIPRGKR